LEGAYTVSQLANHISALLVSEPAFLNISVRGEITNFKLHSSGHLYFSLKDANARIAAVMFRSDAARLKSLPRDGDVVTCRGRVGLYEKSGSLQLYVNRMDLGGMGELYEQFLALSAELKAEGYFEQGRKRAIPAYPQRVAIITSPGGAAVRDILSILARRAPWIEAVVCPASVQGVYAPKEIAQMIRYVNNCVPCDLIVLARGGGSIEELSAFNDRGVADAVFASSLPVVSAVGHETDITICDMVSDLRAPTPSAAAELIARDKAEMLASLMQARASLKRAIERFLESQEKTLAARKSLGAFSNPSALFENRQVALDHMRENLSSAANRSLEGRKAALEYSKGLLHSYSYEEVLSRGFAAFAKGGHPVDAESAEAGTLAEIISRSSAFEAQITQKSPRKPQGE